MHRDSDEGNGWAERLAELSARGLRRELRPIESAQGPHVTIEGRRLCCFASNDYLGLANHPQVRAAAKEAIDRWGWGAGASRLISGHMTPHQQLEARLAAFKKAQAALVCSTGYQANLAALGGLAGKGDVILLDKLDHASIIDGAYAGVRSPGGAGSVGGAPVVRVFPHRDYAKLQRLLERSAGARRRVVVTDSVFSMDGDFADLPRLVDLKRRYDAILCVDEAHATGVFGDQGRGLAEHLGVEDQIDVVVGTLSKALGGIGGFITGSREFIDWLINTARPFIYTTALPPAACAAALAALDLVQGEPHRRRKLLTCAERLRAELSQRGFDIAGSTSQIIPIVLGEAEAATALAARLEADGFLVPAIRPPTVPRSKARLRISLSAEHEDADLERLLAALARHCRRT